MNTSWFEVANADEIPSPALLVYAERAQENIRRMITTIGDVNRLRPHIKTHKMPALVDAQLRAGITKFKCATIAEAEMAALSGAPDLLLAMQPVGPNIGRLIKLIGAFPKTRFSALVDNEAIARQLSAAAVAARVTINVFIDLDPGMHRSGIAIGPDAAALYKLIDQLPGLNAAGLHAYDGHIHEPDIDQRRQRCEEAFQPVAQLAADLNAPTVIVSGTPTFPFHAARKSVECSPGTTVLWDVGYEKFPDLDYLIAACVLTRVVSKPGPNLVCLDLGHKAVASENPQPRAHFPQIPDAKAVMHSEEHLVLETGAAPQVDIGQVFYAFPKHICPTVALYSDAVAVFDGRASERWPITARNRTLTL